tara:strand:+ start:1487 stop:1597 length:111 start_codon:yes stop_codon:yes gene_type:complete
MTNLASQHSGSQPISKSLNSEDSEDSEDEEDSEKED